MDKDCDQPGLNNSYPKSLKVVLILTLNNDINENKIEASSLYSCDVWKDTFSDLKL